MSVAQLAESSQDGFRPNGAETEHRDADENSARHAREPRNGRRRRAAREECREVVWWYFGLILELYLIFPLLFRLLQKVGVQWFLVICAAETVLCRYILLFNIFQTDGMVLSAFCGSRLWEFAFGMVVGLKYRETREWVDERLFSAGAMVAGVAIYTAGLYSFYSTFTYVFTDALVGTGLFVSLAQLSWHSRRMVRIEAALAYVGVYSYGLYLIHQPYATYFGDRMRGINMVEFIAIAAAIITVITIASAYLERYVNTLTNRLLARPAPRGTGAAD